MKNKNGILVNGVLYLAEQKPLDYQEQQITTRKFRKKRSKCIIKNKKRGKNFFS
jgi:hypothetical protein